MIFCTQEFVVFFVGLFAAYWLLPFQRLRVWMLLGASFYFYANWNKWLAAIICVSTAIDYALARGIEASASPRVRRFLLCLNLIVNLGLLCYFKYANFFLQSLEEALKAAGASSSLPALSVILPVGISFYTFEAINYMVDVYRRKVPAERNLANFMVFILFFPHLVAGPIVRARDFLPQLNRPKRWDWLRLQLGAEYFVMGLFKKLAIADRMALYADPVFANPEQFGTGATWVATVAYALQIYCDFSGYTDMAIGCAHMLGYKLSQNFNMPYLAANVSEFWRRWHISLSTWLRDYLFIPLGGSRGSDCSACRERATRRNLLITMCLGGLWHGASWTFVVWGAYHGVLLILHRVFRGRCERSKVLNWAMRTPPGTVARVAATFVFVCVGWVFFRAESFGAAQSILRNMFVPRSGLATPLPLIGFYCTVAVVALAHLLGRNNLWKKICLRLPTPALGFGYGALVALAMLLAPDSGKAFIYFQF